MFKGFVRSIRVFLGNVTSANRRLETGAAALVQG